LRLNVYSGLRYKARSAALARQIGQLAFLLKLTTTVRALCRLVKPGCYTLLMEHVCADKLEDAIALHCGDQTDRAHILLTLLLYLVVCVEFEFADLFGSHALLHLFMIVLRILK